MLYFNDSYRLRGLAFTKPMRSTIVYTYSAKEYSRTIAALHFTLLRRPVLQPANNGPQAFYLRCHSCITYFKLPKIDSMPPTVAGQHQLPQWTEATLAPVTAANS